MLTYVVNLLMGDSTVVLQDIIVFRTSSYNELLDNRLDESVRQML
jgi:hypothetical protein